MKFASIILAAGSSSRMTHSKQLLLYKGQSLIKHTAALSQQLKPHQTICVTGFLQAELEEELSDFKIQFVHNSNFQKGMSSSLVAGIKAIDDNIDGILVMLCDQPLIPVGHYINIIEAAQSKNNPIIATNYNNNFGAPSFFKRGLFNELSALTSKNGAKSIIKNNMSQTHFINCEVAQFDIDTDEDYQNFLDQH